MRLVALMERDKDYLARLDTLDNGKTFSSAMADVEQSIEVLSYYAGWADKIHGDTIPADGQVMTYTRLEPVGVVGQIIPWNYPLAMLAWKWGPALAAGCSCVVKPAEDTPLSALALAELADQAGIPPGVINVVTASRANTSQLGKLLCESPQVAGLSFTGSTQVSPACLS